MSAFTTLTISRAAAIRKLAELRGDREPTNEELADDLDNRLRHTLYNFVVQDDNFTDGELSPLLQFVDERTFRELK